MDYVSPSQQSGWASGLLEAVNDTETSVASVVVWLRSNLGLLNARIETDFQISGDNYIVPEFTNIQSGIYNEFYFCDWLRKQARKMLGSMEFDWVEMEGEDQGRIKRVSHTQKSASYQTMSKDCEARLKELIKTYRGGDFSRPLQITFNHRHSTPKNIGCDCFDWSSYNPICY